MTGESSVPQVSDVLEGRQTPADIPDTELRAAFEHVVGLFKRAWLSADSPDALQALWKRRDTTATWELFWLGSSIARLAPIKTGWLTNQANIIKTGQRNERIGVVFEILALALFAAPTHKVVPAKKNQPGYDGTLQFKDGNNAQVSLKNFARSSHQKQFDINAATTYDSFKKALIQHPRNWTGIAAFADEYPSDDEWAALRTHIESRLARYSSAGPMSEYIGRWLVRYTSPPSAASVHTAYTSHIFQIVTGHHGNESKNVESRLADAFAKFDRHVAESENDSANVMLVRLGETFVVQRLADWARAHLQRVGTHLNEVIFYQPAIALNTATSATSLMHHMTVVKTGTNQHPPMYAAAPVGTIAAKPTRLMLLAGGKQVSLEDSHLFQRGEIYHMSEWQLGEENPVALDFGPNIVAHNVVRMMGQDDCLIVSPRHPLSWTLSLLND